MIDRLRKIYPSLLVYDEGLDETDPAYNWFMTEKDEIIGIHEDQLDDKDLELLTTFLQPYNIKFPLPTQEEKKWKRLLQSTGPDEDNDILIDNPFRFVYFSLETNQIDPVLFRDALQELFAKTVPILWLTGSEGILVDEKTALDESLSYDQIIDVLMSDLYMKIKFFIGPYRNNLEEITHHYEDIVNDAKIVFSTTNKRVVSYIDAVSYLLLQQTDAAIRQRIGETILQEYIDDEETLKMIETLLQCNLNISEASKVLHMHRNSLQYRLDRFYEKTGADIRLFHHALTVHLALLAIK